MKVLKCIIPEQTHLAVKVLAVSQKMTLGDAAGFLLAKGLVPATPAPNSEEQLAKALRYLDPTLFDRIDKIRNERRLSWHQVVRQALASYETQLKEFGASVTRPAPNGGGLLSAPPRPAINVKAVNGSTSSGVHTPGYQDVGTADASDADMDESGTRAVANRR
jgi:hypothetical protein